MIIIVISDLEAFVDYFFKTEEELAVCRIVGHTYDLDAEQMWDKLETIFKLVSEKEDVLPMTHLELVRYLKAMRAANVQEGVLENHSDMDLWFEVDGAVKVLRPGERL